MSDLTEIGGDTPQTNTPEISVSELANALKQTIEDRFGRVRVRGEISNYRGPHASGHAYFCLKDQNARLDAVIWRSTFLRLRTRPQEGLEVVATGRVTTFPGKSSYQIIIESLEPAGVGALMALLDARRKALAAEGLFDEARKRPLPFLPGVVGVVTSPTGAVIRDILHRLNDRFPRRVLVWPVRVQGESCAEEVAAGIRGFNALPAGGAIPRPDVLIVARGGGSLEDLWGFNEELVVRAAAESAIPLISAIGHETDTTLIDFVADLRAPTPTGAAEKAVPVRVELFEHLAIRTSRLEGARRRAMEQRRVQLSTFARLLPAGDALLANPRQRFDRVADRL
ncbi:MAG: exodeoxyribonuclease VII large subunit, partial [Methylocystis sp.]